MMSHTVQQQTTKKAAEWCCRFLLNTAIFCTDFFKEIKCVLSGSFKFKKALIRIKRFGPTFF